jgi:hypothetical protein
VWVEHRKDGRVMARLWDGRRALTSTSARVSRSGVARMILRFSDREHTAHSLNLVVNLTVGHTQLARIVSRLRVG